MESEQFISMVHETAIKYLIRNGTVNLLQEHIDMALFCCRYLSSRPFTTGKSQNTTDAIDSGYFGFLDYAAAHYAAHVQGAEAPELTTNSTPELEAVKAAVFGLTKARCKDTSVEIEDTGKAAQDLTLTIQDCVLVVRTLINLQRENSGTATFDATEGPMRHKCHKIQCCKFSTGFKNEATLKEHLAVHERPYRCPRADCFAHTIGYASPKRLESHDETFHQSIPTTKATFPTGSRTGEWNLHEACKAGDLVEVKRFHREGADLKGTHKTVNTPLCAAAEAGHGPVCKYLVDSGIDPFKYRYHRRSSRNPIAVAITGSQLEILELFLHTGNGPTNQKLAENIALAITANRPAVLNMFLAIRQPRDHEDMIRLVLHEMMYQNISPLVRQGSASHSTDTTLIHAWFQYIKPEFYNEKGSFIARSDCEEYKIWGDIIFRQLFSFHKALYNGCYSLATFLMDVGNEEYLQIKSEEGDTPLHSCMHGLCSKDCSSCMFMVRRLLQYDGGKFSNMMDNNGNLPAHRALIRRAPQAVLRSVLDNTGDANHRNKTGQSLLHAALSSDSIGVLLENKSVDLFSRNDRGQTAFSAHIDSMFVKVDILDCLFKADPRLAWTPDKSEEGFTPLHHVLKRLRSGRLGSWDVEGTTSAAKLLLTCSEMKRVLVEYQAKSTDAGRRQLLEFARKERLGETLELIESSFPGESLEIMDSIELGYDTYE
ncbi:hypothetical protein LB504_001316 [Fusarium proliferatum]|nr:hypothetical protein LB504_001316 [Fusarium proliferatum]